MCDMCVVESSYSRVAPRNRTRPGDARIAQGSITISLSVFTFLELNLNKIRHIKIIITTITTINIYELDLLTLLLVRTSTINRYTTSRYYKNYN